MRGRAVPDGGAVPDVEDGSPRTAVTAPGGAAEKPFEFDLRVTGVDPADQLDVEGSAAAGESGLFHRA